MKKYIVIIGSLLLILSVTEFGCSMSCQQVLVKHRPLDPPYGYKYEVYKVEAEILPDDEFAYRCILLKFLTFDNKPAIPRTEYYLPTEIGGAPEVLVEYKDKTLTPWRLKSANKLICMGNNDICKWHEIKIKNCR